MMSPSLRGRGLKFTVHKSGWLVIDDVALFTRAWIEIIEKYSSRCVGNVALFTRAWIEI